MRDRERLLVLVVTYPTPSTKYKHTVCMGGVTDEGEFRRIYPVPFSDFVKGNYHKRHYIEYSVISKSDDGRKESRKIDSRTVKFLDEEIDYKEGIRKICREKSTSVESLRRDWEKDRTSCGIVKPNLLNFEIIKKPSFDSTYQTTLFDGGIHPEMMDYSLYYSFNCCKECETVHRMTCLDIEAGNLFQNLSLKHPFEEACRQMYVKGLTWMKETREVFFMLGTHSRYPNTWMIGSVLYPPKQINKDLFEFGVGV